jgi:hypothetical protein
MLLSRDKKWKVKHDPKDVVPDAKAVPKRIVFIRHGESEWNEVSLLEHSADCLCGVAFKLGATLQVFNRGFGLSFPVRLIRALIKEFLMLPTRDSVFFDSPLSDTGIKQTLELVSFLAKPSPVPNAEAEAVIAVLQGNSRSSAVVTTSNLRRAIATGMISLFERLRKTKEHFLVLSCLQEVTFNVDGISLLEKGEVPDATVSQVLGGDVPFDATFSYGTKGLSSNGYTRMLEFCKWAHGREEDTVIALGHSLYFRDFFRSFMPKSAEHLAKKKKMVNCGVVAFNLTVGTVDGKTAYVIKPESIVNVYGGFK